MVVCRACGVVLFLGIVGLFPGLPNASLQCMEVSYHCDRPFVNEWNRLNPAPPKSKSNQNRFLLKRRKRFPPPTPPHSLFHSVSLLFCFSCLCYL